MLEQLPTEARIYFQVGRDGSREVLYGVTPKFALSLMDDAHHPEVTVYVEDERSETLVDRIIAIHQPECQGRISIIPVGPASTVRTLGEVAHAKKFDGKTIGILDGDQNSACGCLVMPGHGPPERIVFDELSNEQWETVAQRIGVRPGDLLDAVEDAKRLENSHAWPKRTAEKLGPRVRESRVWEDAAAVWVETNAEEVSHVEFAQAIADLMTDGGAST